MMWKTLAALLLLPAVATATDATADGVDETVIVRPEYQPGPSDTPRKPSMQLELDAFSLNSADFIFPSGLRVIMQEDHTEPLVGITMWVDNGSSSDPIGKEGIAHYVEHLWFKSKHGESIPMVWDLLDEMGCYLNASTSNDWTNYMTVCSSDFLPVMLKLESKRITDALAGVTEEEMLAEREVVRNELRLRMEVGGGEFLRYLMGDVYPEGHPYHRMTIGTHESLSNIELSDIQEFVAQNYQPQDITLVIVGDFDLEEASSLLLQNFELKALHPDLTNDDIFYYPRPGIEKPVRDNPDHWYVGLWDPAHRGEKPLSLQGEPVARAQDKALPPPPPTKQVNHHEAAVQRPTVVVAWAVPGGYRGEDTTWYLLANMLSSEIYQVLGRSDRNPGGDPRIYKDENGNPAVFCTYWANTVNSTVFCMAELANDKVDGEKIGWDIVDQVATIYNQTDPMMIPFMERSFTMARMGYMRDILLSMDVVASLSGRAFLMAEWAHYTGSGTFYADTFRAASQGSVHDAQQRAYEHLSRKKAVISVIKPLPADQIKVDSSEQAWHGASRSDDLVKATAINFEDVTPEFVVSETQVPDLTKLKETTLPNGLRIIALPHGETPIVRSRLIFGGGSESDADGSYTFARTFSDTEYWKNPELDPLQFAADLDFGGSGNFTTISLTGSSKNLGSGLWILRNTADSYVPNTSGKSSWIKRQKSRIHSRWTSKEPGYAISRLTEDHWNPGHPATMELTLTDLDGMSKWGTTQVRTVLDRIYQPANATLLIVGKIDPDEAIAEATQYFGGWRARPGTAVGPYGGLPPANPSAKARVVVFDNPEKSQTEVDFTCQLAPVTPENRASYLVAGDMLSKAAFKILREQLGTTYGAYAGVQMWEGGAARLVMSTSAQNSAAGTSVEVFQELISRMEAGDVDQETLVLQKLQRARKYGLGQQSVEQMTGRLTLGTREGLDSLAKYGERIAAVDADAVSKAVAGCSDVALITLSGPVETVTTQLDALGVTYEVYDWKAEGLRKFEEADPKAFAKWQKAKAKADAKKEKSGESDDATSTESEDESASAE